MQARMYIYGKDFPIKVAYILRVLCLYVDIICFHAHCREDTGERRNDATIRFHYAKSSIAREFSYVCVFNVMRVGLK